MEVQQLFIFSHELQHLVLKGLSPFLTLIFISPLPVAAAGTLVEHTSAESFAHVLGLVVLLHHKRNSHGSLMLGYNGLAGWG